MYTIFQLLYLLRMQDNTVTCKLFIIIAPVVTVASIAYTGNIIQSLANILLLHPLHLLHPLCRIQLFGNILLLHPLQLLHLLRRQDNTVTCKYSYYCCTRCNCCICCIGKIIQSLANIFLLYPLQLLHLLRRQDNTVTCIYSYYILLHPLQLLHRQDNTVTCKYILVATVASVA